MARGNCTDFKRLRDQKARSVRATHIRVGQPVASDACACFAGRRLQASGGNDVAMKSTKARTRVLCWWRCGHTA